MLETASTKPKLPTIAQIQAAIVSGKSKYGTVIQRGGCGRVYVCLGSVGDPFASAEQQKRDKALTKAIRNRVKDAAQAMNLLYLKKAYGVGNHALYIGYDNGTSIAWSQGEQVAKNLKALGVDAYVDGMGD
ncbi:MAG: hypothetical protein RBJ76_13355 [Stenomitos frigidus ULC029]